MKHNILCETVAVPAVIAEAQQVWYPNIWVDRIFPASGPTEWGRQLAIDGWSAALQLKIAQSPVQLLDVVKRTMGAMKSAFIAWLKMLQVRPRTSDEWMVGINILQAMYFQYLILEFNKEDAEKAAQKVLANPSIINYAEAQKGLARRTK